VLLISTSLDASSYPQVIVVSPRDCVTCMTGIGIMCSEICVLVASGTVGFVVCAGSCGSGTHAAKSTISASISVYFIGQKGVKKKNQSLRKKLVGL